MTPLVSAALAGLALAVLLAPAEGQLRLARAVGRPPRTARAVGRRGVLEGPLPVLACLAAGIGVALLVGGLPGLALAVPVVALGPHGLRRLEPPAAHREREQLAAALPLALDLLGACLVGGAPLPAALRVVAEAVPGTCGRRFADVAAALDVGSGPEAWWLLAPPEDTTLAGRAARALARAGEGGAPVKDALGGLVQQARADALARGRQAAERAGVLAVAPLGLCFLPAFVVLGVVPLVIGLVGPALSSF